MQDHCRSCVHVTVLCSVVEWNISVHYKTWAHTQLHTHSGSCQYGKREIPPSLFGFGWLPDMFHAVVCEWMTVMTMPLGGAVWVETSGCSHVWSHLGLSALFTFTSAATCTALDIYITTVWISAAVASFCSLAAAGLPPSVWFMRLCRSLLLITGWECDRSLLNQIWFSVTEL